MTVNIFDEAPAQKGEFMKWLNIGDSLQGTYIDVYESKDSYDNEQRVYVLKDSEDKIWNVAFKMTNPVILEQMERINFGQIIGFKYEEERPSRDVKLKPAKIIVIYSDVEIVDQDWLDEQEKRKTRLSSVPKESVTKSVESVKPEVAEEKEKPEEDSETIKAIRNLAMTQGLTTSEMTIEEQDEAIATYALLPLNAQNQTQIIIKLTGYTK